MRALISVLCLVVLCACGEPVELTKWGGWEPIPGPSGARELWTLAGRSSTELWAADTQGQVFRFNGRSWSNLASPVVPGTSTGMRPDLQLVGTRDAFLVTSYEVFQFEGTVATSIFKAAAAPHEFFTQAFALDVNDLWVQVTQGDGKTTVLRWDGTQLRQVEGSVIPEWGAVADDAWGIQAGDLFHWDGTTWQAQGLSGVRAVWGTAKDQAWAVGERATLWQWDGTSWRVLAGQPRCANYHACATFNGVWGTGPNDLWLVGESGPGFGGSAYAAIHHWDGQKLKVVLEYGEKETLTQSRTVSSLGGVVGFADAVYAFEGDQLLRLVTAR